MTKNKFKLIYDDLAKQIQGGTLNVNDLLPSEHDLSITYQASRETIRKALKLLSEHGYIQKMQGKGSVVLDMRKINFPISGLVSFKELAEKIGKRSSTTVISLQEFTSQIRILEEMELSDPEEVWEIIRVRDIDQERIILDKDYVMKRVVPSLTREVCEHSIYEYFEENLGLSISFAKKEITVETPTKEDKLLLDLDGYSNIVVVRSHVYLENAMLFQYTESRHRPDKFRFVDFARRGKN
ncbi:trehalose operon repressor [Bacillus solitudinis]|uniref:trehalose operon repressor n=1 Tax=Bacillus solitudinis TaxID=2014074 RepID=UPI000C250ED9|nr:trehalose operon repressor [Bacillus solitudinis]